MAEKEQTEGVQTGFPKSPSEFDADDRISFSKLDGKFLLETDEGTEFEWDTAVRRWVPVVRYKPCGLLQSPNLKLRHNLT